MLGNSILAGMGILLVRKFKINRETMITNPIIITPANTVTRAFKNFMVGATKISF